MNFYLYSRQLLKYLKYPMRLHNENLLRPRLINNLLPSNQFSFLDTSKVEIKKNVSVSENLHNLNKQEHVNLSTLDKNLESLTDEQVISLIENCVLASKHELHRLWQTLEKNDFNFKLIHYHTYIKTCTVNQYLLNSSDFLLNMKCEPVYKTYKLLLENVCEKGNIIQAFNILNLLKEKDFKVDEEVFNLLILGHTVCGGLNYCVSVLETMKSAKIAENNNTKLAIIRGSIIYSKYEEFKKALEMYPIQLDEEQFFQLLLDLGKTNNYMWINDALELFSIPEYSKPFINKLETLCSNLIQMEKPKAAASLYQSITKSSLERGYGKFLLEQMLLSKTPVDVILNVVNELHDSELNVFALEDVTEIAMQNKHFDAVWYFLNHLQPLRTHYFWPLLINATQQNGEPGAFDVLKRMHKLNVRADYETFTLYLLPNCDLSNGNALFKQLLDMEYSAKELLTPFLVILLYNCDIKQAQELCYTYHVRLFGEKLIKPLITAWKVKKDIENTASILQKIYETNISNEDWIGNFLIRALKISKSDADINRFIHLMKCVHKKQLCITPLSADVLVQVGKTKHSYTTMITELADLLLDFSKKQNESLIPHPRDMNIEQLECHLIELENKKMEVRGVLRKLIQLNSNIQNYERVKELHEKFLSLGYGQSIGMKSSLMHTYINANNLNEALKLYEEINMHSNFVTDEFKIIDLAALMVENNKFEDAIHLLNVEAAKRKVKGGLAIQKNCWRLLLAAKNPQQTQQLFEFLIDKGYCKASNVILGPLVRIHLNRNDLKSATKTFIECSKKYTCTPLQLELLYKLVESKDELLFQQVLEAASLVHGVEATQLTLLAALAENGMEKPVINILTSSTFRKGDVEKRCKRWVIEKKLLPLETIANAIQTTYTNKIELPFIHTCIMQIHSNNNDCESALEFWNELIAKEMYVSNELNEELVKLLKRCKYSIPAKLQINST